MLETNIVDSKEHTVAEWLYCSTSLNETKLTSLDLQQHDTYHKQNETCKQTLYITSAFATLSQH